MQNDNPAIRFGAFELLPAQRRLTRHGASVPLGSREMDLLLHLTAHAGTIVSKDSLSKDVWSDRIVDENNLNAHMTALRKALGGSRDEQPIVQTVTGHGYIFIAAGTARRSTAQPPPMPAAQSQHPAAVPRPPTRLIGRGAALAELRALLRTGRIVTIVGPGGVGKTSLALQLAADLAAEFSDGVAFADLSGIADPVRVPEAVAAVLVSGSGANTASERLTAFLQNRQVMLVLDNCEHLVEPVARLVSEVLDACSRVVILATSREGLCLNGEQIFRLAPLRFPTEAGKTGAAVALDYDAVRLFVERAEAVGGFVLDDASAPVVATICASLDGIPLAIEMAVARLKVLSLAELSDRLDERFRLLTAPGRGATSRHRTLQAVIDWSYDFLPPEEAALLRALSTFAGGADLGAIRAITNAAEDAVWELLDRLTGLADKSLLIVQPTAERRFRLLETIRQYAAVKLRDAGEVHLFSRHAACFADRFTEAARVWPVTPGPDWLHAYGMDADNLRSALGWCFGPGNDSALGLRLVASSVLVWWELPDTPLAEGQRWFDTAATHLRPDTPEMVRGWVRFGQSWRDFRFGDRENLPMAMEAVALFRSAGDPAGLGAALWRAGSALLTHETADQAEACLTEAETVLRGIAPGKWLALTAVRLADLRFRQGRLTQALAYYQEGFALSRATQFWIGLVNGGSNMAELLFAQGEVERALRQLHDLRDELPPSRRTPLMATLAAHLLLAGQTAEMHQVAEEAIDQAAAIGLTAALAWTIEAVALLCATEGNIADAARLAGYSRAVHPSVATRAGARKMVVERLDALFAGGLTPAALSLAMSEGGQWTARTAAEQARLALRSVPRTRLKAGPGSVLEKPHFREELRRHLDRLESELIEAREEQLSMVPDTFPCPSGGLPVAVHASMRPAREVGGDFYDCFEADSRTLCVAVGDVAGKGMPAALFMARARSLLRTVTLMLDRHLGHTPAPDEVAVVMNEELCKNNPLCNFVTLFIGLLDTVSGTLRYVNAGHVRPYMLPRDADPFEYSCPSDVPLGFEQAAVFRVGSLSLCRGDALVVVSDGVHDMETAGGLAFGRAATLTCLAAAPDRRAEPLVSHLMAAVLAHGQGAEQTDDVTILALHLG